MKLRKVLLAVSLFLPCVISHRAAGEKPSANNSVASPQTLTLQEYIQQLHDIDDRLNDAQKDPSIVSKALQEIPQKYKVHTESRDYELNNGWLRDGLSEVKTAEKPKQEGRAQVLRQMIEERIAGASAFAKTDQKFDASARQQAAEILSRDEFHHVAKPEFWRLWLQKIYQRIIGWLLRLVGGAASRPWVSCTIVWGMIGLACCGLIYWIYRRVMRPSPKEESRTPILFAASRKSWRIWLRDAQEAAQRGDFREAMHLAYWAAISRLEEAGTWPADRTRTPREYLTFLKVSHPYHAVLLALTRNFELIWYGNRPATQEQFEEACLKVEALQPR